MSTEVKHGPTPEFEAKISGEFSCTVVGHYTDTPNLAAAGVTHWKFESTQPIKQQTELLALRTAFKHWFETTMRELGGDPGPGSPYRYE